MEKLPHQEYRDDLAHKLKEIRDAGPESEDPKSKITRAKAEGFLEAKQETKKYKKHEGSQIYYRQKKYDEEQYDKEWELMRKKIDEKIEDILASLNNEDKAYVTSHREVLKKMIEKLLYTSDSSKSKLGHSETGPTFDYRYMIEKEKIPKDILLNSEIQDLVKKVMLCVENWDWSNVARNVTFLKESFYISDDFLRSDEMQEKLKQWFLKLPSTKFIYAHEGYGVQGGGGEHLFKQLAEYNFPLPEDVIKSQEIVKIAKEVLTSLDYNDEQIVFLHKFADYFKFSESDVKEIAKEYILKKMLRVSYGGSDWLGNYREELKSRIDFIDKIKDTFLLNNNEMKAVFDEFMQRQTAIGDSLFRKAMDLLIPELKDHYGFQD
jgi:hypothetical protein